MHFYFLACFFFLAFVKLSHSAYCHGSPADGERVSEYDILAQSTSDLTFVKEVQNGRLYTAGPENATFYVSHLWGTPYEKGYAQGQLYGKVFRDFFFQLWDYFLVEVSNELENMPPLLAKMVTEQGLERTLDWTYEVTRPYSPDYFYDEMRGLSDASGVPYEMVVRVHMLPELTKGSCSMAGAWKEATVDGKTIQLRSLDYITDVFENYPAISVYHPEQANQNAFINIGFVGFVGAITGMNDKQMAISEIGVSYPDDTFGQGIDNMPPEKVKGTPFVFMLRDILEHTATLDASIKMREERERTCNLVLAVGDGKAEHVYGIQYSGRVLNPFDDTNYLPANESWSNPSPNTVFCGMDWLCPSFSEVLNDQLTKYWGELSPEVMIKNVLPTLQSGDLHIAVYDLTDEDLYLSFHKKEGADPSEFENAYER
jgi:hypothetical protein